MADILARNKINGLQLVRAIAAVGRRAAIRVLSLRRQILTEKTRTLERVGSGSPLPSTYIGMINPMFGNVFRRNET